jgi:hypothetical protein
MSIYEIPFDSKTLNLARVFNPSQFLDVLYFVVTSRYMSESFKLLDSLQCVQVIVTKKEFLHFLKFGTGWMWRIEGINHIEVKGKLVSG